MGGDLSWVWEYLLFGELCYDGKVGGDINRFVRVSELDVDIGLAHE